jgi:hypothetical protein
MVREEESRDPPMGCLIARVYIIIVCIMASMALLCPFGNLSLYCAIPLCIELHLDIICVTDVAF